MQVRHEIQSWRLRAVTLVELLIVAVLLGIVAVVAVSSGASTTVSQLEEAACRIQGDLAYAQSRAIILRSSQTIACDVAAGLYLLAPQDAPSTPINETISKKAYRVFFQRACNSVPLQNVSRVASYPEVGLLTADFDGAESVTFNAYGLATTSDGTPLSSGRIEIRGASRSLKIVIDPATGTASIQELEGTSQSGLLSWLLGGISL